MGHIWLQFRQEVLFMDMRYRGQLQGDQVTIQFLPSGETFDAWETAIAHQDWLQQMEDLWEKGGATIIEETWLSFKETGDEKHPYKVRLYRLLEAADYLGGDQGAVSQTTVNRWRKDGWLRAISVGRGWLYTKEGLDDCLRLRGLENRITEE
jgi:hypothetical protein